MIGIVLVSHGSFAEGLRHAAEMIVGPQERLQAIGMALDTDPAHLRRELEAALAAVGQDDEVLILVDILGGSPANASASFASDRVRVICGVNLPMVLEVLTQRAYTTIDDLANIAAQAAKESIINLSQQLRDI